MKNQKINDIIKSRSIVVPLYLYKMMGKLNITTNEFLFLMYLYNQGTNVMFDPMGISNELGLDIGTIMTYVDALIKQNLIEVKVQKNDKGIMEEYVSTELFTNKVSANVIEELNKEVSDDSCDIYSTIEKEFGRTLSPIEYEIVKAWLDNSMSIDLIKEALKEATYNGVSNLRYIDKILYEWGKKGIKTVNDVEKQRKNFKEKKEEKPVVFEYDWLDDDDE